MMPIVAINSSIKRIINNEIDMYGLNADLNHINVSRVTNLSGCFHRTSFNGDISQWDVSNVTEMNGTFAKSSFNGDISQWDVSNVTSMTEMFESSPFNGDISQWDVSNVKNLNHTFTNSAFNGDISKWDLSSLNLQNLSNLRLLKLRDSQRIMMNAPKQIRSFVKPTYTWQDYKIKK